jgi:hypothetical protein
LLAPISGLKMLPNKLQLQSFNWIRMLLAIQLIQ